MKHRDFTAEDAENRKGLSLITSLRPSALSTVVLLNLLIVGPAAATPRTVPTFHCMSLYWPVEQGGVKNGCAVQYRAMGEEAWKQGHELWWDAKHGFYAGAVVSLPSGMEHEFKLTLGSGESTTVRGKHGRPPTCSASALAMLALSLA